MIHPLLTRELTGEIGEPGVDVAAGGSHHGCPIRTVSRARSWRSHESKHARTGPGTETWPATHRESVRSSTPRAVASWPCVIWWSLMYARNLAASQSVGMFDVFMVVDITTFSRSRQPPYLVHYKTLCRVEAVKPDPVARHVAAGGLGHIQKLTTVVSERPWVELSGMVSTTMWNVLDRSRDSALPVSRPSDDEVIDLPTWPRRWPSSNPLKHAAWRVCCLISPRRLRIAVFHPRKPIFFRDDVSRRCRDDRLDEGARNRSPVSSHTLNSNGFRVSNARRGASAKA